MKREIILNAAIEEFGAKGFAATSMDALTSAAGVSKRTVYSHFPSKEALFEAILTEAREHIQTLVLDEYVAGEEIIAQLTEVGVQIALCMTDGRFVKLARIILSRFIHSPEQASEVISGDDVFIDQVASWLQGAQTAGELKSADSKYVATEFAGLIKSFVFWPQLYGRAEQLAEKEMRAMVAHSAAMIISYYSNNQPK